jgi:hypothetical protein
MFGRAPEALLQDLLAGDTSVLAAWGGGAALRRALAAVPSGELLASQLAAAPPLSAMTYRCLAEAALPVQPLVAERAIALLAAHADRNAAWATEARALMAASVKPGTDSPLAVLALSAHVCPDEAVGAAGLCLAVQQGATPPAALVALTQSLVARGLAPGTLLSAMLPAATSPGAMTGDTGMLVPALVQLAADTRAALDPAALQSVVAFVTERASSAAAARALAPAWGVLRTAGLETAVPVPVQVFWAAMAADLVVVERLLGEKAALPAWSAVRRMG